MAGSLNSQDYQRLVKIEKLVLANVEIASRVTGELAKLKACDAAAVKQLCQDFMNNMKTAHELVAAGVQSWQGERAYELHAYHALCKAHIASEKLDVMGLHLDALQRALQLGAAPPPEAAAAPEPCTAPQPQAGGGAPGSGSGPPAVP